MTTESGDLNIKKEYIIEKKCTYISFNKEDNIWVIEKIFNTLNDAKEYMSDILIQNPDLNINSYFRLREDTTRYIGISLQKD